MKFQARLKYLKIKNSNTKISRILHKKLKIDVQAQFWTNQPIEMNKQAFKSY